MIEIFTTEQLAAEWMRRTGLLPLRSDCSVDLSTGEDTDGGTEQRIKDWYAGLLESADSRYLPTGDFGATTIKTEEEDAGSVILKPPGDCARALSVKLTGWKNEATVTAYDEATARRQRNPYTRAGRQVPVAMLTADGKTIRAWPGGCGETESLTGVMRPDEGMYALDRVLLTTIKPDLYD